MDGKCTSLSVEKPLPEIWRGFLFVLTIDTFFYPVEFAQEFRHESFLKKVFDSERHWV